MYTQLQLKNRDSQGRPECMLYYYDYLASMISYLHQTYYNEKHTFTNLSYLN